MCCTKGFSSKGNSINMSTAPSMNTQPINPLYINIHSASPTVERSQTEMHQSEANRSVWQVHIVSMHSSAKLNQSNCTTQEHASQKDLAWGQRFINHDKKHASGNLITEHARTIESLLMTIQKFLNWAVSLFFVSYVASDSKSLDSSISILKKNSP